MNPVSSQFSLEVCCPSLNRSRELARLRGSLVGDCIFSPAIETQPRSLTQIVNELFLRSSADIVVMAADHLEFKPPCLEVIRECFLNKFPDLDGVVGLNLCNLPRIIGITEYCFVAVGRTFLKRFWVNGEYQGVFCPEYYHFYGDTEFGIFANKIGKFCYDERAAVFTWHPNARNAAPDKTHAASRARKDFDDAIWKHRQAAKLLWGESFAKIGPELVAVELKGSAANPSASGPNGAPHPARPAPPCRQIEAPPDQTETNAVLESLGPDDELTVADSANPAFDNLKLRLFEREHVGCDPVTRRQTWRGAKRQRPSCPPLTPGSEYPTIINFYTLDTPYAPLAERLKQSCEQFGLPHVIEGIKTEGSWEFNCALKSRFILRQWQELGKPVLWLDADAIIRRPPTLLAGLAADFAIHKVDRWEFASGTVFFNQTPHAHQLLQAWVRNCHQNPQIWDQQSLDAAWEEVSNKLPLKTFWLPESYTRIFDRHISAGEDSEAVIEHFQASRELKRVVSDKEATPLRNYPPEFIAARSASRPFRVNGHTGPQRNGHAPASPRPPTAPAPLPAAPVTPAERDFIRQLFQFFNGKKVLLIEWFNDQSVRLARFHEHGLEEAPVRVDVNPHHPRLPIADAEFDTVVNFASITRVSDGALSHWLRELHRVANSNLWVALEAVNPRNYAWWKTHFAAAGFQPHSRLSELNPPPPSADGQGAVTFVREKVSATPLRPKPFARPVAAKTICLATNYLLMSPATRQMWADLGQALDQCGCQLVLLSTTLPEQPLPFPLFKHPYLMRDFAAALPDVAPGEGICASPFEMEWLQADISRVPGGYPLSEALAGLSAFRAYFRELWRTLQPGFLLTADNTLCQTALLQKICFETGLPVQIYERGLLPETLMLESRGIQAWSDMRTHWLAQDWPASAYAPAAYERIRAYYLSRRPQKYAQADFAGGGPELRCKLGLDGNKVVVFLGGGYEANGHAPKGGIYERHFYTGFPTTESALMALGHTVGKMPGVRLVFKAHPLDPQTYSAAQIAGVQIVRDVNVHALIDAADVVAAQYTTLQFEAALYDKPILALARSAWWGRHAAYEVEAPEDLPGKLEAALERRDWPTHQVNARAFNTWMMDQVLVGCTAEVPARRNLQDLAKFIARTAIDPRGLPSAEHRCEQVGALFARIQAPQP